MKQEKKDLSDVTDEEIEALNRDPYLLDHIREIRHSEQEAQKLSILRGI